MRDLNLFRIQPNLPAQSYDTYEITRPRATHMRRATCEEVNCERYVNGWVTVVDERTDLGARQAHYIRHDRSRKHAEGRTAKGWTEFRFEAGQQCFTPHEVAVERDPLFVVSRGDWRGLTNRRRVPVDEWLDRFGTNQENLKGVIERG